MTSRDACALLGLKGPVGGDALKSAFRVAAKAARPDQGGGDHEKFRRIIEAYRLLQALEAARAPMTQAPPRPVKPAPTPALEPVRPTLEITPTEAMLGLVRHVEVARGRALGLRLPAGLRSSETVRLAGQAEGGGDLLLTVAIGAQGGMRVIGDDLWLDWPVEALVLTMGGRIRVATPTGEHSVTVPPALPAPYRLRLKNKGLPACEGKAPGHLFLTLKAVAVAKTDPAGDRLDRFKRAWMRRG
jgi:curved DNA-binding protein